MKPGVVRTTVVVCLGLAAAAWAWAPQRWQVAGGVIGGGLLVGLSSWAIRGAVDGMFARGETRPSPAWVLVKFFTRHGMLALAAYGMMARLHLDPVGMMVGVSSLVLALGVDALRRFQRVS